MSDSKIAVCLSCGNEWEVRKLKAKQRKCPVCGKYRIKFKDEISPEEYEEIKKGNPEPEPEKEEEIENIQESEISEIIEEPTLNTYLKNRKKQNKPEKKIEGKELSPEDASPEGGSILFYAILIMIAAGIGYFLYNALGLRRNKSRAAKKMEIPERPEYREATPY